MSGIEESMSVESLRKEVRRLWEAQGEFMGAIESLPEMLPTKAMEFLEQSPKGTWPHIKISPADQRRLNVPPKSEYETAAGVWMVIRKALIEFQENCKEEA